MGKDKKIGEVAMTKSGCRIRVFPSGLMKTVDDRYVDFENRWGPGNVVLLEVDDSSPVKQVEVYIDNEATDALITALSKQVW